MIFQSCEGLNPLPTSQSIFGVCQEHRLWVLFVVLETT